MAFTPFVETDQPTMAEFNEKFQECIGAAVDLSGKIEAFSYVGTGTWGPSYPNTITCSFAPILIMLIGFGTNKATSWYYAMDSLPTTFTAGIGFFYAPNIMTQPYYGKKSEDGKSFSWYVGDSSSGNNNYSQIQCNQPGVTYYGIAFA